MGKHKRQHYIPSSYLKPWCDQSTPKNRTPYVWRFDADGSNPGRKAPENIFHETDIYTILTDDGKRNLVLEHGLSGLESKFAAIRKRKLDRQEPLEESEHFLLCAFVAAMHSRTPAKRDHLRQQWTPVLRLMEEMVERAKQLSPEELERAATITSFGLSGNKSGLNMEQVKQICGNPIQMTMRSHIKTLTPMLAKLDVAVFDAPTGDTFITSDHPCVWYDSKAYKRPPLHRSPGLAYETIEITLPISPKQIVCFNRMKVNGYLSATPFMVNEFNRRTRFNANKYFVVNGQDIDPYWFDPGIEPDDSWENTHGTPDN